MSLFVSGATRRASFYAFLALPLFACSSSSGNGSLPHIDASSPIDASIPAFDAAGPTDAPLPKDLETCNATASPSQKGPTGTVAFAGAPLALGDGVRNGVLIASLMTAGTVDAPMQGLSSIGNSNAIPLSSGDHVLQADITSGMYYTFDLVPNGDAKLNAYESAATIEPTTDIALREMAQSFQSGVTGGSFTATPGAPATEAGDTYVWEIDAMALFDATISVRFTKDAACHVRNIARILGQSGGPVALHDVLASGDGTRSLVEKYAKTAPASEVVLTVLTTLTTAPGIDPSKLTCSFTDLTTCDAAVTAIDSAETAFAGIESKSLPTTTDYANQTMPNGWSYGTAETQPVGE
jgi:hypothetical protein